MREGFEKTVRGDAQHLLRVRFVLGAEDGGVGVRIFVKEVLDVGGEGFERAREGEEARGRVEDAEETGFEDFLEFLFGFEELRRGLAMSYMASFLERFVFI